MNETSTLKDFPLLYNSLESLDLPQHPNAIHHSQCAKLHKLSLFANLCRGVVIVTPSRFVRVRLQRLMCFNTTFIDVPDKRPKGRGGESQGGSMAT